MLLARLRPAPPRPHTCPLSPTAPSPHPAVNTLHPGVVNTELARYLLPGETAWWQQPLLQLGKTFSLTPEQGAQVGCGRGRRPASRRPLPANAACDAWHHAAAALHRTCASRLTPASLACPPPPPQTSIYLASSAEAEGLSGKYWDKCRPVSSSKESYDPEVARRLYDVSAELVGL